MKKLLIGMLFAACACAVLPLQADDEIASATEQTTDDSDSGTDAQE